jgi:hypothetical protein
MALDSDAARPDGRGVTRRQVLYSSAAALAAWALPTAARAHAEPTSQVHAGRVLASLNGVWDFLPSAGTPSYPPPDSGWATIPVPAEWNMTAGVFGTAWDAYDLFETPAAWDSVATAWYRRSVTVPAASNGDRIALRFEAVNFESTVFWNGTQVAHNLEGLLPFEVDVTDQVTFGAENTIHVLVRSPGSAARDAAGFHHPCGSWWGQLCSGIWQDVLLISRTPVSVADTAIVTSVRQGQLSATTNIRNDGAQSATVWVRHAIKDGDAVVLQTAQKVTIAGNATAAADATLAWRNPRLWSPDDPHLYDLVVGVAPAQDAPASDVATTRFGFREVWVEGDSIMLNGAPVMLRGDAWHYMGSIENSRAYASQWMSMAKAAGVNYMRLHAMPYPSVFYDVADEVGMLIVGESGIYGSSGNYAMGADDFWDNCNTHLTNRIRRDINHASIIAWSVENEMLAAFGRSWTDKVAALKSVAKAADPSRPAYFEGDGDPNGQGDFQSTHYPLEITSSSTAIPESGLALAPGHPRAGEWDRKKPFLIGEFSSMYYANPSDVSTLGGPDTYAGLDGLWAAHALTVRAQIEGFRYAGITGISPWNTVWYGMRPLPFDPPRTGSVNPIDAGPQVKQVGRYASTLNPGFEADLPKWQANPIHDAVARVFSPIAALAMDYRTHYWSGGTLTKTLAVYNGTSQDRALIIRWSLRLSNGRTVSDERKLTLSAASQTDLATTLAVSEVATQTAGTWKVTVSSGAAGGHLEFSDIVDVTVYPTSAGRQPSLPKPVRAAVLEAAGSSATSDALTALGVTTRVVSDLSTMPSDGEILVIGEGANYNASGDDGTRVTAFVKAGGTVLILAQQTVPQVLPWPMFSTGSGQTISHISSPAHPTLQGIDKNDLRWWHTENEQVVGTVVVKPRFGSLRSIADVGVGMADSALAECAFGAGTYLLCQYPVVAAAADEPIAAILLGNIVRYLAGRGAAPTRKLGVLSSASTSAVAATLQAASIAPQPLSTVDAASLQGLDILLVDAAPGNDAALNALAAHGSDVSAWVHAGGVLWINGADPDTVATIAGVLPANVSLQAVDSAHRFGAVVTDSSPLGGGITNADLNWPSAGPALASYTVSAPGGRSVIDTRAVDWNAFARGAEQNKYAVALESERGFTPGSALWEAGVGSGTVLVDQLGWPTGSALPAQVGLAASLAASLGAEFVAGSGSGLLSTTGWTAFVNPPPGENPKNAYDRNPSTRWSSDSLQQPGMYFGLDLGAAHNLTKIVWDSSESPGDCPKGLQLLVSTDNTTWTTLLSIPDTSSLVNAGVMTLNLSPPVEARYFKIVDTASAPGNYLSLHEIYVYAQDS